MCIHSKLMCFTCDSSQCLTKDGHLILRDCQIIVGYLIPVFHPQIQLSVEKHLKKYSRKFPKVNLTFTVFLETIYIAFTL